jgi:hypothetical protein
MKKKDVFEFISICNVHALNKYYIIYIRKTKSSSKLFSRYSYSFISTNIKPLKKPTKGIILGSDTLPSFIGGENTHTELVERVMVLLGVSMEDKNSYEILNFITP